MTPAATADLEAVIRDAVLQALAARGLPVGDAERHGKHHENGLAAGRHPLALVEADAPPHVHGRQSGSEYCTQCGGCMEPAVYETASRATPSSTAEMIDRLDRFTELVWRAEPQDITRLRQLTRPPMGRMPGVFYANFNLFWLGENLQTLRDKARAGTVPVEHLNEMLAAACLRSAVRLSKWKLLDVIFLLSDVVGFAQRTGCATQDELRELIEHLLLAVDRVQTWVDRIIPWHRLDAVLEPVP